MAGDLDIYEKQGFGNRIGFGGKPALIVIDFINAFNDPDMFGGGSIQSAIDHTEESAATEGCWDSRVISICRSPSRRMPMPPTAAKTASST